MHPGLSARGPDTRPVGGGVGAGTAVGRVGAGGLRLGEAEAGSTPALAGRGLTAHAPW